MLVIYGKTGCGSCVQAKQFCDNKGLDHVYLALGKDYQLSDFVSIGGSNHKTFPLITEDGKYLGTFADLQEKYKNN